MAFNKNLEIYMNQKVGFVAPVFSYPGEDELEALAMNALLVARNEVVPKEYKAIR
jgi:butyrate kinase